VITLCVKTVRRWTTSAAPGRYTIESVREIARRTAHKVLRIFGMMDAPSLVPSGSYLGERDNGGTGKGSSGPRITFIRS
jgi:hypothetical protein